MDLQEKLKNAAAGAKKRLAHTKKMIMPAIPKVTPEMLAKKEANKKEEARRLEGFNKRKRHAKLMAHKARIPHRYKEASIDHFPFGVAEQAIGWLDDDLRWSCMIQNKNYGIGKTHLAWSILKFAVNENPDLDWIGHSSSLSFLSWIKEDYQDGSNGENRKRAMDCEFLIIDDLAKERVTEDVKSILLEILHHRDANVKKTIITSNESVLEIGKRLDESIKQRLVESGGIKFNGENKRLLSAEER